MDARNIVWSEKGGDGEASKGGDGEALYGEALYGQKMPELGTNLIILGFIPIHVNTDLLKFV